MNVIFLSNRRGRARQYPIWHPVVLSAVIVGLGMVLGAGLVAGYWLGGGQAVAVPAAQLDALKDELGNQQTQLAAARQANRETVDALAVRLADLNAQVIRLNALGRRLTKMGKLDDGEFDFENPPALGGPEPGTDAESLAIPDLTDRLDILQAELTDRRKQLAILENLLLNRNLSDQVYPKGRPVKSGWISSHFGTRTDPFTGRDTRHRGMDFAGRDGAEIVAVAAGVVTWSGDRYGYGNLVEINHGNGYVTRYAHNKENLVVVGDEIDKGQTIALMGATGRATGPNLHFEVLRDGHKVNPLKFIRGSK